MSLSQSSAFFITDFLIRHIDLVGHQDFHDVLLCILVNLLDLLLGNDVHDGVGEHFKGRGIRRHFLLVFLWLGCVLLERLHLFDVLEHDFVDVVLLTEKDD